MQHRSRSLLQRLARRRPAEEWTLDEDIRDWLPDEDRILKAELPVRLPAGEYELSVGIDTGVPELGRLNLAIEGRDESGLYLLGSVTVGGRKERDS